MPIGVFPEGNLRCPPDTGQATLVGKCVTKPIDLTDANVHYGGVQDLTNRIWVSHGVRFSAPLREKSRWLSGSTDQDNAVKRLLLALQPAARGVAAGGIASLLGA